MTPIDILFVHNNFPAQFRNLAVWMARHPEFRVKAIGARGAPGLPGIEIQRYSFSGHELATTHAFARRFEIESRRAEQVMYAANALKSKGFAPRLIYVHPGWGEALPLRVLFPEAVIASYCEFYYAAGGTDLGYDAEFPQFGLDGQVRVVVRNAGTLLSLAEASIGIAPTAWQKSVFPREFQHKIHIAHDGIDCQRLQPTPAIGPLPIGTRTLPADSEIVTFVARNLEPYRGFHIFMRALPAILKARPRAQICILGGDQVSYGLAPPDQENWRLAMLDELKGKIDPARVHFLGQIPYEDYLALLRRSNAHVYLTYPFVLSWSVLEAMALECLVIGSRTPPVEEVVIHGQNGLLVPFFDVEAWSDTVIEALANADRFRHLRWAARNTIINAYDFDSVCLPAHLKILSDHADKMGIKPRLGDRISA